MEIIMKHARRIYFYTVVALVLQEMVGDLISHALTHCVFVAYTHTISSIDSARTTIAAEF